MRKPPGLVPNCGTSTSGLRAGKRARACSARLLRWPGFGKRLRKSIFSASDTGSSVQQRLEFIKSQHEQIVAAPQNKKTVRCRSPNFWARATNEMSVEAFAQRAHEARPNFRHAWRIHDSNATRATSLSSPRERGAMTSNDDAVNA